jgi:hypothetical protein
MVQGCANQIARRSFHISDGVKLSSLEAGQSHAQGGALTIVFVPGWSMPAEIWRRQLEEWPAIRIFFHEKCRGNLLWLP